MGKIALLDCTLRDGGYVNDWAFGEQSIRGFCRKIAQTGIEMLEVGFLKGDSYNPDKSVFPDIASFAHVIAPKAEGLEYVGMLDMSDPVPLERLTPNDGSSIDGIRVIFKKDKLGEAHRYCERIKELGYFFTANFVSTDLYSDKEFIEGIERFNELGPRAMTIVDTFGLIKRKHFLRLAYLADNNLLPNIALAYHAHNNLQQAYGNAEALVEMGLKRDVIIDACVFGMGRGAGNLNLELFADYLNENYGTHYKIEPMLEIMDEYLNDIYQTKFWGYSLPLYLSASTGSHPNYAIYLAEKNSLPVKAFNELLQRIPPEDKAVFSQEKAERYYREYMENYIDDKETVQRLSAELQGKRIVLLAPGRSLNAGRDDVDRACAGAVVMATNFTGMEFTPDYVFSSNMRRYAKIQGHTNARCIVTSNMQDAETYDYMVNFSSYASQHAQIIDNSGLMLLKLLMATGVKEVFVAGMDGYTEDSETAYYDTSLYHDFSKAARERNELISGELREIARHMRLHFITPSVYQL